MTKSMTKAIGLMMILTAAVSYAGQEKTVPHVFKAGDVLSSDMINEIFTKINKVINNIESSDDLVGTWACTSIVLDTVSCFPGWETKVGLYATRTQTITFTNDGDGTYSFATSDFSTITCSNFDVPRNGDYAVVHGFVVQSGMGGGKSTMPAKLVNPAKILLGPSPSNDSFSVCQKQMLPPNMPTAVAAVVSNLNVALSWTDASDDEVSFTIMRKDELTGNYADVGTVTANGTSYTDTVPTAGKYWYRVVAKNGNGKSVGSNVLALAIK